MRRLPASLAKFILLIALACTTGLANAQTGAQATLIFPEISAFPQVSAYLDVRDTEGNFVQNLEPTQISILEDGNNIPLQEFSEFRSGAQFGIVISPGHSFTIRDGEGINRYARILAALRSWASSQPATSQDDLSLMITDGPQASHLKDANQWLTTLDSFQSDMHEANPNLDVLIQALETVSDQTPRPGMGRGLLFITAPLDQEYAAGLSSLAAQATSQKVQVSVWMVSAADEFESTGAAQLQNLAEQTGGHFFAFSGSEEIPNLEDYLAPLRETYRLAYRSQITTSGTHQLVVQIHTNDLELSTVPYNFDLNIQPPNPIFVSPPADVLRENPDGARNPDTDLQPTNQDLDIIIEFPDGLPRQIITSTLYVDGMPFERNLSAPFNKFSWNLSSYLTSGEHKLRVEVVDSLGLAGSSIEVPVQLTVHRTPKPFWMVLEENALLLAISTGVFILLLVFLGLIVGGKLRPAVVLQGAQAVRGKQLWTRFREVSRPVPPKQLVDLSRDLAGRHTPGWMNRNSKPELKPTSKAFATLLPISDPELEQTQVSLSMEAEELSLGRDMAHVDIHLTEESVDPIHARLVREGNSYRIYDSGSLAGTWVNYVLVPEDGMLLENGDLVHFGRSGFRFALRDPAAVRKVVIHPEESWL